MGKNSQIKSAKSPIPDSPTNVQWSCQPFRGWGMRQIWHFSNCHPSTKWPACVYHVVVFKTKVLHFKTENKPIKDTNGKSKFKRMLSFLFVDKQNLFAMALSFKEFNPVFYKSECLACFEPTRQRGFWRNLRYIPYSMIKEKYVFKRKFLYFKGFMDGFLHFDIGVKEKPQNVHLKLIFYHVLDWFNLCERNDITCLMRIAF